MLQTGGESWECSPASRGRVGEGLATVLGVVMVIVVVGLAQAAQPESAKVGLITKTDSNPFFVKMRQGARERAGRLGMELLTAAGKTTDDNASQVVAIENMMAAGVRGILITPSVSKAIVPAIRKARAKGVLVIALDSPTDPENATDALFATDNFKAGALVGQYARAATKGRLAKVATLDEGPGSAVGALRHKGFLEGFGIAEGDAQLVCEQPSFGDRAKGQTAMENCLQKAPGIDVVFTVNEPTAAGARTALTRARKQPQDVVVVSIDGGCAGVRNVGAGVIDATAQQYPLRMAALGVDAVAAYARDGKKPSGYTDTGVNVIAARRVPGVASEGVEYGLANCWE
jgi:fructose transport system substrate-binding protein